MAGLFCNEQFLEDGAIMSVAPDLLLVGWGESSSHSVLDPHATEPSFYLPDFFLSSPSPWKRYRHSMVVKTKEFKQMLKVFLRQSMVHWCAHQPEQFKHAFEELLKLIKAGRLEKAVPYLFARSNQPMTKERLCQVLHCGLAVLENKTGYFYGHWNCNEGILGLTPELLFSHTQKEPSTIHTMAVAGTCHPTKDRTAFFNDKKERHEHQLVVQGICQSLGSLGRVHVGTLQLLELPRLVHLMTPILLEINELFNFDLLVQKLHPTPALGAFPIHDGKKWLQDFDRHTPRHRFGAPIGFHHPESGVSKCLVAIRNVQWDQTGMRIGAGCGVVKQSTFEKEWKEIHIKIRAIRDMFQL